MSSSEAPVARSPTQSICLLPNLHCTSSSSCSTHVLRHFTPSRSPLQKYPDWCIFPKDHPSLPLSETEHHRLSTPFVTQPSPPSPHPRLKTPATVAPAARAGFGKAPDQARSRLVRCELYYSVERFSAEYMMPLDGLRAIYRESPLWQSPGRRMPAKYICPSDGSQELDRALLGTSNAMKLLTIVANILGLAGAALAASRTTPPAGAKVVAPSGGQYTTVSFIFLTSTHL
jgi:hypothetical protein